MAHALAGQGKFEEASQWCSKLRENDSDAGLGSAEHAAWLWQWLERHKKGSKGSKGTVAEYTRKLTANELDRDLGDVQEYFETMKN